MFRLILNFYIKTSLHVGVAVCCFVKTSFFLAKLKANFLLVIAVFFATVLGYNLLKYWCVFVNRQILVPKHLGLIIISFAATFGFMVVFIQLNSTEKLLFVGAGLLTLFYPIFRKNGILKLFWIGFVVSFVTVFIPLNSNSFSTCFIICSLCERFFIVVALMIPFEIYHYAADAFHLKTLPQRVGILNSKKIGYFFVALAFATSLIYLQNQSNLYQLMVIETIMYFSILAAIYFSKPAQSFYFTAFWVESIPIFWWLLFFVCKWNWSKQLTSAPT